MVSRSGLSLVFLIAVTLVQPIYAGGYCPQPQPHPNQPQPNPSPPPQSKNPSSGKAPYYKPPSFNPPYSKPPTTTTPIGGNPPIVTPIVTPPVTSHPPHQYPPSIGGGGFPVTRPPPVMPETCPINEWELGLCVDILGGLVHIGIGDPLVNTCCPILGGLLDLEAAVCLCTTLRLKILNFNLLLPLALQVLVTCGKTPPPGFVCHS